MSERVYKLLDGSELLVNEEVMGWRKGPNYLAVTIDGNHIIDDVLALVDVGNEAARELEYAKKQVITWNDEAVRLRKELEDKDHQRKTLLRTMQEVHYELRERRFRGAGSTVDPAIQLIDKWLAENKAVD